MKLGNLEIMGDLVLAPMAGVTDLAFRTICAELGAAVTVTEMVSSRALIYQDKKSRSLLHKTPLGVCGAQIFGNDPSVRTARRGRWRRRARILSISTWAAPCRRSRTTATGAR